MRPRTPVLAFLVLLGGPAVCTAGPIDFSYTAIGAVSVYPDGYEPGPVTFSLDAGGNVRWPGRGGAVELGSVQFGPSPGPQGNETYTAWTNFAVSVTVTDQMTGQAATLELPGGAVDDWTYRSWDGRWMNTLHRLDFGDWSSRNTNSVSADIGHTGYTLSVRPEGGDQVGVYTLTATATNPEPGTLALGLLALAPIGLRRLRRT